MEWRKNTVFEDDKQNKNKKKHTHKKMNIANFINIYLQIYIPILYVARMTQNKNDALNSILQHGRIVDNNCCVVFPTSRFAYLILCPR